MSAARSKLLLSIAFSFSQSVGGSSQSQVARLKAGNRNNNTSVHQEGTMASTPNSKAVQGSHRPQCSICASACFHLMARLRRTCCTSSLDSWRARASLRVSTVKALRTRSFSLARARISPSSPPGWLDPPLPLPGAEGPPGMREATPREIRTSPPIEGAVRLLSSFRPASR